MAAFYLAVFAALLLQVNGYGFNPQDAYNSYQTLSKNTELPFDCPFHQEPISMKHPEDTIKGTLNQDGNYAFDKYPSNLYSNVDKVNSWNPYQQESYQQYPQSQNYNGYQSQTQNYPSQGYNQYQSQQYNGPQNYQSQQYNGPQTYQSQYNGQNYQSQNNWPQNYQSQYNEPQNYQNNLGYPAQNGFNQGNSYQQQNNYQSYPEVSSNEINQNFIPNENFVPAEDDGNVQWGEFCGTTGGPSNENVPEINYNEIHELIEPNQDLIAPPEDADQMFSALPYFGNGQQSGKPFYGYDEPYEQDAGEEQQMSILPYYGNNLQYGSPLNGYGEEEESDDEPSEQQNDPAETRQVATRAKTNIDAIYEGANEELAESKANTDNKSKSSRQIIEQMRSGNQGARIESFKRGLFSSLIPSMSKNVFSRAKSVSSGLTQLATSPLTGFTSALKKGVGRNVVKAPEPTKSKLVAPTLSKLVIPKQEKPIERVEVPKTLAVLVKPMIAKPEKLVEIETPIQPALVQPIAATPEKLVEKVEEPTKSTLVQPIQPEPALVQPIAATPENLVEKVEEPTQSTLVLPIQPEPALVAPMPVKEEKLTDVTQGPVEMPSLQNPVITEEISEIKENPLEESKEVKDLEEQKEMAISEEKLASLTNVEESADEENPEDAVMTIMPFFPMKEEENSIGFVAPRMTDFGNLPSNNLEWGSEEQYQAENTCANEANKYFEAKTSENLDAATYCMDAADRVRGEQMQKGHAEIYEAYENAQDQHLTVEEQLNMCAYSQYALCQEEREGLQAIVTHFATEVNNKLAVVTKGEDEHAAAMNACVAQATATHNQLQLQHSDSTQICQENDEE